jgi:MFS family permease
MNGVYLCLVIIGNYLGPVAAGYVAVNQNWRWVFWYCTIFMSIVTLAMFFFLEESKYIPRIMHGQEVVPSMPHEDDLTKVSSTMKDRLGSISIDATEAANNQRRRLFEIDMTIPMDSYWKRHRLWSPEKTNTTGNRSYWMHFFQVRCCPSEGCGRLLLDPHALSLWEMQL